jgi:hypothetical protein
VRARGATFLGPKREDPELKQAIVGSRGLASIIALSLASRMVEPRGSFDWLTRNTREVWPQGNRVSAPFTPTRGVSGAGRQRCSTSVISAPTPRHRSSAASVSFAFVTARRRRAARRKRRSVLTVMPWSFEVVREWVGYIRPLYDRGSSAALWPSERGARVGEHHLSMRFAGYRDHLGLPPGLGMHSRSLGREGS